MGFLDKSFIQQIKEKLIFVLEEQLDYFQAFYKKEYLVALDIGTASIKLVLCSKKNNELVLLRTDIKEFARFRPGKIDDKEKITVLEKITQGIDIRKSVFVVSINGTQTSLKTITTPFMPKDELKQAILLEAKNHFPFDLENVLFDFEVAGEIEEDGVKKYRVNLVTVDKQVINETLSLLNKVGIRPAAFVPVSYALYKMLESLPAQKNDVMCCLDIGQNYSELIIFKKDDIIFSRKIPVTGNDFTKALTNAIISEKGKIELSWEEAEKIKREMGLTGEGNQTVKSGVIEGSQVVSLLRLSLDQLISEVDRCFAYYRDRISQRVTIDSLVLSGCGALLKGLPEFLSEELSIAVITADFVKTFKKEVKARETAKKNESVSPFAVAVGLTKVTDTGINLLPLQVKQEKQLIIKGFIFRIAAVFFMFTLISTYIAMQIKLSNYKKHIAVAQKELASLEYPLQMSETNSLISGILAQEPYWTDIFKELSRVVPQDIYLTELSVNNGNVVMIGMVVSRKPEGSLYRFISNLEKGMFKNVKLLNSREIETKTMTKFELHCSLE